MSSTDLEYTYRLGYQKLLTTFSPPRTQFASDLLSRGKELGLDTSRTCLSIGPADGSIDLEILKVLTQCEKYTAVEPDGELLLSTSRMMEATYPHIQCELVQHRVDDWPGPGTPVDVILVCHVLYYVNNPRTVVKKLLSWLRPGGLMIILQTHACGLAGLAGAGQWSLPSVGDKAIKVVYTQERLENDLKDITDIQVIHKTKYVEAQDLRGRNVTLATFLLLKSSFAEPAEVDGFYDRLYALYPSGIVPTDQTLTVIRKTDVAI